MLENHKSSDVVLGLGPWLSLRTKFQSLVLSLALTDSSITVILTFLLSPTSNLQLQEHDVQNSSVKKTYYRLRLGRGAATSFGGA